MMQKNGGRSSQLFKARHSTGSTNGQSGFVTDQIEAESQTTTKSSMNAGYPEQQEIRQWRSGAIGSGIVNTNGINYP